MYDKHCPTWLLEKEIVRVKFTTNVSFPEARKKVEAAQAQAQGRSYAAAAATNTKPAVVHREVQTEIRWPVDSESSIVNIPTQREITPRKNKAAATSTTATDTRTAPAQKTTPSTTAPAKPKPSETMRPKIQLTKPLNVNNVNQKQQQQTGKSSDQRSTGRQSKGSVNPIRLQNQFSSLEDMDVADAASDSATDGGRGRLPLPKS